MSLFSTIQAAITLVFIYLILSLLTSEIQEQTSAWQEFRARRLKQSIRQMFGEESLINKENSSGYWDYDVTTQEYKFKILNPKKVEDREWFLFTEDEPSKVDNDKRFFMSDQQKSYVWLENNSPSQQISPQKVDADSKKLLDNPKVSVEKYEVYQYNSKLYSFTDLLYQSSVIQSINQSAGSVGGYWLISIISLLILIILAFQDNLFSLESILCFIISLIFLLLSKPIETWANKNGINFNQSRKSIGPSYIDPPVFFTAILEVIQQNLPEKLDKTDDLTTIIQKLEKMNFRSPAQLRLIQIAEIAQLQGADSGIKAFQKVLQDRFEKVQERCSGVYKRNAKGFSLIIGFIVAVIFNADSFNIVKTLSQTSNNIGDQISENFAESTTIKECADKTGKEKEKCIDGLSEELNTILETLEPLPIGWDFYDSESSTDDVQNIKAAINQINQTENCLISSQFSTNYEGIDNSSDLAKQINHNKVQECWRNLINQVDTDSNSTLIHIDNSLKHTRNCLEQEQEHHNCFTERLKNELQAERKQLQQTILDSLISKIENPNHGEQDSQLWNPTSIVDTINSQIEKEGGWPLKIVGWFITAIATMMGAPFWFQILSNITNVRSAQPLPKEPDSN